MAEKIKRLTQPSKDNHLKAVSIFKQLDGYTVSDAHTIIRAVQDLINRMPTVTAASVLLQDYEDSVRNAEIVTDEYVTGRLGA
jgi:hypothetical protein